MGTRLKVPLHMGTAGTKDVQYMPGTDCELQLSSVPSIICKESFGRSGRLGRSASLTRPKRAAQHLQAIVWQVRLSNVRSQCRIGSEFWQHVYGHLYALVILVMLLHQD